MKMHVAKRGGYYPAAEVLYVSALVCGRQRIRSEQADEEGWLVEVDIPIAEAEKLAASADGQVIRALLPERVPEW